MKNPSGEPEEKEGIGWRARLGVIVLSTNLTVEYEFRQMVPDGVSFHVSRCLIPDSSRDEREKEGVFLGLEEGILQAGKQVAMSRPDVILFACTVGSFLGTEDRRSEISDLLTRATGIESVTMTSAVLEAIQSLKLKKVTLISPYPEGTGMRERDFLERSIPGLTVVSMKHLGIISSFEKSLIPYSTTYRLAKAMTTGETDGLFLSCSALRTMEIIGPLEKDLGIPVVTSTQAGLWACLRRCRVRGSPQFGRLFDL
jgi:maleate isomerase